MRLERTPTLLTLCAVVAGCVFFWVCPLMMWHSIIDGLLIFLGLIVASLIQVIPVTANFLQAERLSTERIRSLRVELDRQQSYWLGLLILSIIAVISLVLVKVMTDPVSTFLTGTHAKELIARSISGILGFSITFILFKFFGIIPGIKSLQNLRFDLALEEATDREQREAFERLKMNPEGTPPLPLPQGFGGFIDPIESQIRGAETSSMKPDLEEKKIRVRRKK